MAKMTKTRLKPTKASKERKETDKDIKSIVMTRICQKMENAKNNLPAGKSVFHMASLKILLLSTKRDSVILLQDTASLVHSIGFRKRTRHWQKHKNQKSTKHSLQQILGQM